MRLAPQQATRLDAAGQPQRVHVEALQRGDRIVVAAGEGLPCDGVIVRGTSLLDRSLMTGESVPVAVAVGDPVEAGSANLQSPLELTVEAVGRDSRIGQLLQLVEDAALEKSPSVQWADRIGGIFVMVVIGLALVTLIGWTPWAGPFVAAQHAV